MTLKISCGIILFIAATDVKDYLTRSPKELLAGLECPCGGRLFIFWGSYCRKLLPGGELLPVQRVRCKVCLTTHAILPSFLFGRVRHTATTIDFYFQQWVWGDLPVSALWVKAGAEMEAPRTVATLYTWIKRFRHHCGKLIGHLKESLLELAPGIQLSALPDSGETDLRENVLRLIALANDQPPGLSKAGVRLCWHSAEALLEVSHALLSFSGEDEQAALTVATFLNFFCAQKTGHPLLAPLARAPTAASGN